MSGLYTYFRISEAAEKLAALYGKHGQKVFFLVPATLDKDTLTDLITGGKAVFGERPVIMTIGELYKTIEKDDKSLRVIDPPDHKLILKYLVEEYKNENDGRKFPAGMEHAGFVTLLSDNIHILIKEGISPELLYAKLADGFDGEDDLSPEEILYGLYRKYTDYLDKNGLADAIQIPDKLRQRLVSDSSLLKDRILAVVGFSTFTGNQLKLFEQLGKMCGCVYFMPRTGMTAKGFRGGIQQLSHFDGMSEPQPCEKKVSPLKIMKLEAGNTNLEYMAAARELALWRLGRGRLAESFGGLSDFGQIGILSSPQTLDSVENELRRYNIPYNVVLRGTVLDTPLGRLPQLIWNACVSQWDTRETAALLSEPLLSPDGFDRRKYLLLFPRGEENWHKVLKNDGEALDLFGRLADFCRAVKKKNSPVQLLSLWKTFLETLNAQSSASKLVENNAEYDYTVKNISLALHELDKKIAALQTVDKNIGEASKVVFEGGDAINFLLDWASTATLSIQLPQKNCVTLYGKAPATFEQHDFWIMTDIDAKSWPGTLRDSPLLRREQLAIVNCRDETAAEKNLKTEHIPTLSEQREQKELLLRRLLATAKKGAVIARSLTDENGRPLGESVFVPRLFDKTRTYFSQASGEPLVYTLINALPQDGDDWFEAAEIPENMTKTERGKFPRSAIYRPEELVVSLSKLDDWLKCPYLYWCRKAGLQPWNDSAFDKLSAGNLNHKLWEGYWKQPKEWGSLTGYVEANWENEAVRAEYPALSSQRLKRRETLMKQQALSLAALQDAIEAKAKAHNRTKVEIETDLKGKNGCDFEIDGVKFRGKFDRLDVYSDNKAVILDYKLGTAEKHENDLQLAAYAYLLTKLRGLEIAGFGWLGHADGKLRGCFTEDMQQIYILSDEMKGRTALCKKITPEGQIAKAEEALNKIAEAVRQGSFEANYAAKEGSGSLCQRCVYQTLCRRREDPYYSEASEESVEEEA
ncbi:MAG: PD-(D/E)XK nuclease family protein [Synergistaceae bacterium]|nr:PD-(D/E)XK nuclease family protein [Synergistaceae bacterium]